MAYTVEGERLKWRMGILASACALSIGSHFGSSLLGPLKSQLSSVLTRSGPHSTLAPHGETSGTLFSVLISSFQLINTITPLIGFHLPKFGIGRSAIGATAVVMIGQGWVWWIGLGDGVKESETSWDIKVKVWGAMFGLFVFGLGMAPLSVIQEAILVKHFSGERGGSVRQGGKDVGLGLSVGFGLLLGKISSFLAALLAVPLAQSFLGPNSPFLVSFLLSIVSFAGAFSFIYCEKRLLDLPTDPASRSEAHSEVPDGHEKAVRLSETTRFGDAFWCYVIINVLAGIVWFPMIHLSTDVLHTLYDGLSLPSAAFAASTILLSSVIFYPLVGHLLDRYGSHSSASTTNTQRNSWSQPSLLYQLMLLSSILTLATLIILLLPLFRVLAGPLLAVLPFAVGYGPGPLFLVLAAPRIVDRHFVSTVLGIHKSLEMAGATIGQTAAGFILDYPSARSPGTPAALQPAATNPSDDEVSNEGKKMSTIGVLWMLLVSNVLLIWCTRSFQRLAQVKETEKARRRGGDKVSYLPVRTLEDGENDVGLDPEGEIPAAERALAGESSSRGGYERGGDAGDEEGYEVEKRGRLFMWASAGTVAFSWVFFISSIMFGNW